MIVKFRIRRDTAANWTAANPVLALGEPGLETDTRRVKYGDGTTAWNSLSYSRGTVEWGQITGTLSAQTDLQAALDAKQDTITAAALTKTDDTNVTLTLGGSPSTALLAGVSLALGWSGQLSVARGGTGTSTATGTGSVVLATGPTIDGLISTGVARFGTSNPGVGTVRIGAAADALYVVGASLTNGSSLAVFDAGTVTGGVSAARYAGNTTGDLKLLVQQSGNGNGAVEVYGVGTGDALLRMSVSNATTYWSVGIDNSDSDAFVIAGFNPGTGNGLRIDASTKAITTYGPVLIGSDTLRITTEKTPASASATGTKGDMCWDANYLYICTATNTWRRIAHATW